MASNKTWKIQVAQSDRDDNVTTLIAKSLRSFFDIFFDVYDEGSSKHIFKSGLGRRLIVIPSLFNDVIKCLFGDICNYAYGDEKNIDSYIAELSINRYLFLRCERNPSLMFECLRRTFDHLRIGKTAEYHSILPAVTEIIESYPDALNSRRLQFAIEQTCFPSGVEEMQEVYLRDSLPVHQYFAKVREIYKIQENYEEIFPAIRLLFGAYAAGDIDASIVEWALKNLGLYSNDFNKNIDSIEKGLVNFNIASENRTPLFEYLKGRKILLIEDRLNEQGWSTVIPAICRAKCKIEKHFEEDTEFNGVVINHANNTHEAMVRYNKNIIKHDIILLDLYSSCESTKTISGHLISDIGYSISQFHEYIEQEKDKIRSEQLVPICYPKIIVFTADYTGLTTRTMIKELGASEYFFKTSIGESHKSEYYATFRNAIITALKEAVTDVLAFPKMTAMKMFNCWLWQFLPYDRPIIIKLMKHFRYYSAMSIVSAFDRILFKITSKHYDGKIAINNNEPLNPNRYWVSYLGRPNKSGPIALSLLAKTKWMKLLRQEATDRLKESLPVFESYEGLLKKLMLELSENGGLKEKLTLVLVDDMIISGGQLKSYLWKFINRDLRKNVANSLENENDNDLWQNVSKAMVKKVDKTEGTYFINFVVISAVGIRNNELESMLTDISVENDSISGIVKISLCNNDDHLRKDDPKPCNCETYISIRLYIADYTDNISDICEKDKISLSMLERCLNRYVFITATRKKECPCQFEPFGWKKTGGLIATYANTPGNSLPIIWGDGGITEWSPLLPRFFNPWDDGNPVEGRYKTCDGTYNTCIFKKESPISFKNKTKCQIKETQRKNSTEGLPICWCK